MFIKNKMFYIFLFFIIVRLSLCQDSLTNYVEKFKYQLTDGSIYINLFFNQNQISKNDTIDISIYIENTSKDTILVFNEIKFSTTGSQVGKKGLILDFGGMFSPGGEMDVIMKMIKPNTTDSINFKLDYDYFIRNGLYDCFNILFSFGYIKSLGILYANDSNSLIKTTIINSSLLKARSSSVFKSLTLIERSSLYIKTFFE